MTKADQIKQ